MTMSNVAAPAGSANSQRLRDMPRPRALALWKGVHAVLRGRRRLLLGALVAGLGIFAGWLWLGAAALRRAGALMRSCSSRQAGFVPTATTPVTEPHDRAWKRCRQPIEGRRRDLVRTP